MNTKYGLHINIIRDFAKLDSNTDNISYLLSLLKHQRCSEIIENLYYYDFLDTGEDTQIFYVERIWDNKKNGTLVFFSTKYWSLNDYLNREEKKDA
jgi:hypothetical protein